MNPIYNCSTRRLCRCVALNQVLEHPFVSAIQTEPGIVRLTLEPAS
jgi:hypothetical protein